MWPPDPAPGKSIYVSRGLLIGVGDAKIPPAKSGADPGSGFGLTDDEAVVRVCTVEGGVGGLEREL